MDEEWDFNSISGAFLRFLMGKRLYGLSDEAAIQTSFTRKFPSEQGTKLHQKCFKSWHQHPALNKSHLMKEASGYHKHSIFSLTNQNVSFIFLPLLIWCCGSRSRQEASDNNIRIQHLDSTARTAFNLSLNNIPLSFQSFWFRSRLKRRKI